MQVHYRGAVIDKVDVRLNPGGFVVLDFGLTSVHVLTPADADEIIRAGVEAKRLLAPPDPCAVCGHAKGSHWEHAEPEGPRAGCGILGCPCTRYADLDAAAVLAQSIAAGTPVITDDEALPDCARPGCGHPEHHHVSTNRGPIADGHCTRHVAHEPGYITRCGCGSYLLPDEAPAVTP